MLNSPLCPGGRGARVSTEWCITLSSSNSERNSTSISSSSVWHLLPVFRYTRDRSNFILHTIAYFHIITSDFNTRDRFTPTRRTRTQNTGSWRHFLDRMRSVWLAECFHHLCFFIGSDRAQSLLGVKNQAPKVTCTFFSVDLLHLQFFTSAVFYSKVSIWILRRL